MRFHVMGQLLFLVPLMVGCVFFGNMLSYYGATGSGIAGGVWGVIWLATYVTLQRKS